MGKKLLFSGLFLFCCFATTFAQQRTVTGKVTSTDGSPLVGATVLVVGHKTGVTTGPDGTFSINVPENAKELQVSYVGSETKTVDISSTSNVTVSLASTATNLSDVVVVGYGTVKKKDLTGAVSLVQAKDFNQGVTVNPIQQIQGKVSGLVITLPGGDPNANPIIRLRGQTSLSGGQTPLIVLDGVPLDDPNEIANIPSNDILSYDVLKDASATAIYGSRGANGVIIINTKKGKSGKALVEYDGYVGMDKQSKKYDFLTAAEWRKAVTNPGSFDKGANTDWVDAITRVAYSQSHNVAVSGGANGFNYRASVNYLNQQGIIINSGKEQYGLRFNAQQKAINDKLELQVGILSTQTNRKLTNYGNVSKVYNTPPVYPVYNPDGTYFAFSDFEQYNAVEHINEELNKGTEYLTILYGTANYQLFDGLKGGVTGSLSHFNRQNRFFQPSFPLEGNVNNANDNTYNEDSKKGDIHLNYLKDFGEHNIGATAVYEYNYFTNNSFSAGGQQFIVPENQDNNLGSGNSLYNSIGSYREEYKLISFLGRINYNYAGKYFLTASIRRDGSSKFGKNNRWGNFPSVDVAWVLSQENFLKNVSWLNQLKLRVGYGETGNSDAISPYSTLLTYGPGGRYYNPVTQTYPQTYSPNQNANPDLKWETRKGKNLGLDFALFNNRLTGDFNIFRDVTDNLLYTYTVPTPPFFINTILANVGSMSNKGEELSLTAEILRGKKLNWTFGGQITFIKTRVESLSGTYAGYKLSTDQIPGGYAVGRGLSSYPITFLKPGYAPYEFYLPHFTGVDKDGNQLLDGKTPTEEPNPKKYYIDPSPKFTYGINNTFSYGNWSLNFFLRGVYGQKIFNNTLLNFENINRLPGNNVTKEALTNGIKDAALVSDHWLQKASYLRLDNATLAYTFNHIPGIESLRVYVAGNNLFVITPYGGLDPEIQNGNTNQAYIDVTYYGDAFYPRTRSVSLGVNVSFK
ncbi:MAG TPA: TonB-dependent receptor [Hanamia sp.]|nr:TonB-dependent receptor [Hanamia sp.]